MSMDKVDEGEDYLAQIELDKKESIKHVAKEHEIMWLYSMGKRFKIRGIFTTDEDANQYMESHRDTGLIAEFGPFLIIANLYEGEYDGENKIIRK